jgi:hypothetical protein
MAIMIPTREAAERISREISAADEPLMGLRCECGFGEGFDVLDTDSVFRIMEHSQYDHGIPYEVYRVTATLVTW